MRMKTGKTSEYILSEDVYTTKPVPNGLISLARRLNIPLSDNKDTIVDPLIASYLSSVELPPMEEPQNDIVNSRERLLHKVNNSNGRINSQGMNYKQENMPLYAESLLMSQIPDTLVPENMEPYDKQMLMMPVELPTRETRSSNRARNATKTRGTTRGGRNSRKGGKNHRDHITPTTTVENWAQCENCKKWRRLPISVDTEKLPDLWVCAMNVWDPTHNNCNIPEETYPELNHNVDGSRIVNRKEDTLPQIAHVPVRAPEPALPQRRSKTGKSTTVPAKPTVTASSSKSQAGKLMDHEVVELLLSDANNHPLKGRLTMHSLDKASMLATELPHDVLMLGDIPTKKKVQPNEDYRDGAGHLIKPEEDLLKDDPSFRDDGTVSIGIAGKTHWGYEEQLDASTIDSVDDMAPPLKPHSRKKLAALFPLLMKQLPTYMPLRPTPTSPVSSKRESRSVSRSRNQQSNEVLSAMDKHSLASVLSVYATQQPKKERIQTRKHSQLEGKLMACNLPVDTFLQPLSLLGMPLPYPYPPPMQSHERGVNHSQQPLLPEDLKTEPSGHQTRQRTSTVPPNTRGGSKRRSTLRSQNVESQPAEYSEAEITKMREEYARRSVGKSYFKKLRGTHPDVDYPAPDSKRLSKRISSRYARTQQVPEPVTDEAEQLGMSVPRGTRSGLPITAGVKRSPIAEKFIEQQREPGYQRSASIFGVDMSYAMEYLNCPIAIDKRPPNPEGNKRTSKRGVMSGMIQTLASKPKHEIEIPVLNDLEDNDVNMDIYKNPRLLTEV